MNFYILTSNEQEKEIVLKTISIIFSILTLVYLFNIFINPYGNAFFKIEDINSKAITNISKYDKLILLKEKDLKFNAYVIGSSQISRYYAEDLNQHSEYDWISFPIESSMSSEHYYYMKFFTKNFKIEKIIYGIDYSNVFSNYIFRGNTIKNKKEDYNLLDYFTFDTLVKSIDKINFNRLNKKENIKELNIKYKYFNGWIDKNISKTQLDKLLTDIKPSNIKKISKREEFYLKKIKNEFGEKIIPVISFSHPYVLGMLNKKNYMKFISTTLKSFNYVWHINPKYLKETLSHKYYWDHGHTNRLFGKRIINSIMGKDDFFIKVDKDIYIDLIDKIYDFSCNQNFSQYTFSNMMECK